MTGINRALMGAEQPTFEESGDTVNARQWLVSRGLGTKDDVRIVNESFVRQRSVYRRSIGAHLGAWRDVFTHERQERIHGGSLDAAQSNSSKAFGLVHFDSYGNGDQVTAVMALRAWALVPDTCPSPERKVCLIDLNRAGQQAALRAHHRSTIPMQHSPRGLVTAQAKNPLQPKSADALLHAGDVPGSGKPHPQRRSGLVEDGPSRDTGLMAAGPAYQAASRGSTRRIHHSAGRAAKAGWPSQLLQVRCASLVAGKPVLELTPRLRVVPTCNGLDLAHLAIVGRVELNG